MSLGLADKHRPTFHLKNSENCNSSYYSFQSFLIYGTLTDRK